MPSHSEYSGVTGPRGAVSRINSFLYSYHFIFLVAALTVISNVFAAEIIVYPAFIFLGIYISLCCPDFLPLVPLVAFAYITPSVGNNPGQNPESIFYPRHGGFFLIAMVCCLVVAIVVRFVLDRELRHQLFHTRRQLLPGMLLLGLAYVICGIGSKIYPTVMVKNILFGLVQFVAVAALYLFLSGAVRWEKVHADYFPALGSAIGVVLVIQVVNVYLGGNVIVDGAIDRENISTGWGMYNNMGGLLAMMAPFPFYFACTREKPLGYNLLGTLLVCGVAMTCSRSSILGACGAYAACFALICRKGRNKKQNFVGYGLVAAIGVLLVLLFLDQILGVFRVLVDKGLDPSSRDRIYRDGIRQYLLYPVLGGSFYPEFYLWSWSDVDAFVSFFPPRWHNTLVQVAASCGTVGLVSYGLHRFQTVRLFLKKENRTMGKLFIGLSLAVLLCTGMLDCHFFNIGPVLIYSMALAFAEKGVNPEKL